MYGWKEKQYEKIDGWLLTYLLVLTCGCSAAFNWKPGPHAVSTIVKCLQSPGCC